MRDIDQHFYSQLLDREVGRQPKLPWCDQHPHGACHTRSILIQWSRFRCCCQRVGNSTVSSRTCRMQRNNKSRGPGTAHEEDTHTCLRDPAERHHQLHLPHGRVFNLLQHRKRQRAPSGNTNCDTLRAQCERANVKSFRRMWNCEGNLSTWRIW